jgi:ATP-dependent RNA helicase DDX23/PRP28
MHPPRYLRRPIIVTIGSAGKATDNVAQRVIIVKENEKAVRLEQVRGTR